MKTKQVDSKIENKSLNTLPDLMEKSPGFIISPDTE